MKSDKKKLFSWFKPIPALSVIILGLIIGVSLFLVKKPEILAATYAKEDINLGIYKFGLYYPSGTNQNVAPYPVIIVNHGMAAQYAYYVWFAEAMANKGYIVAMPNRIIPGVNMEEGKRLNNFILAYLSAKNRFTTSLEDKVDLTRVGIVGHSMGADVALFSTGVSNLKAVLAIAPADKSAGAMKLVSGLTTNLLLGKYIEKSMNTIYSNVSSTSVPIMYLTGSLDSIVTPEASKTFYGLTTKAGKALLILNGANHVQFSPTGSVAGDAVAAMLDNKPTMAASKLFELTITYGGAWFDYFLKGDQAAKTILDSGSVSSTTFSTYQTSF